MAEAAGEIAGQDGDETLAGEEEEAFGGFGPGVNPNFYVPQAPHWQQYHPNLNHYGTPQPFVHPNLETPTPEQLMARYYPTGFYTGDPVNDKYKYEYAKAAHAEDYYWLARAHHTTTMNMLDAARNNGAPMKTSQQFNLGRYAANYPMQQTANKDGKPVFFSPGEYIKGVAGPLFSLR